MKKFLLWMGKKITSAAVTAWFFMLTIFGIVYALTYPTTPPNGEVVGGKFRAELDKIWGAITINNTNVGIGTTPEVELHVKSQNDGVGNADIGIESSDGYKWTMSTVKNSGAWILNRDIPGTYSVIVVERNGDVHINGNGFLNAAAWTYASDKRLKEHISPLNYGLKDIMKLDTKKFDYVAGEKNNFGFIAQEVQPIFPELVTTWSGGMLGLKTDMLIPILVNATKEQQAQIEELKREINILKKTK